MIISGPKRWNSAKNWFALAVELLTYSGNTETHQLGEFRIILASTLGFLKIQLPLKI